MNRLKKIIIIGIWLLAIVFISNKANSQTQLHTENYTINTNVIPNPERGFYHHTSTGRTGYSLLNQTTLTNYRVSEKISTIYREFDINEFLSKTVVNNTTTVDPNVYIPISQTYLNNMQLDFNALRGSGTKAIVRFSYSKDENESIAQQPVKANILMHINQLQSIINANKDVIVSIQAGFIGTWGEWYYTGVNDTEFGTHGTISTVQWNNRNQILTEMENKFSPLIPLQVRYVDILDMLRPGNMTRVGIYNDAFLNAWGDSGTYHVNGALGTNLSQQNYLVALSYNLPTSGETDAVNAPRTDCPNALIESDKYNWSLLNTDYHQTVISNWQSQGCYIDLQRNLGYRFELINSTITTSNILTLNIRNTGFANVFKDRKAYIILRNSSSQEYKYDLNVNLKNWNTSSITTIVQDLNYINLPTGTYKLYLELPDPLNTNIAYKIQTANLGTWESSTGYNDLNQGITIGSLSTQPFIIVTNNIIMTNNIIAPYTMTIYTIQGRKLKHPSYDISDLKPGYYIIKIKDANGVIYSQQIIKQ